MTRTWNRIGVVVWAACLVSGCSGGVFGVGDDDDVEPVGDDDAGDDDDHGDEPPIEEVPGAQLATLAFSHDRGFFDAPFELTITGIEDDCTVHYTVDGSDPVGSPAVVSTASPATVWVDPASAEGRSPAPGFVVRAYAICGDRPPGEVTAHTFVFVDQAAALSPDDEPPGPQWPPIYDTSNGDDPQQAINYGLDPDVVHHPAYADLVDDALLAIPSISLATDIEHLFDPDAGIYVNAMEHGLEWERPVSVEWIDPEDDGTHLQEFQVNAGLRIRGGWSRHTDNPKHAFRIFFRTDYGPGELEFPLFGDEGTDHFDDVDLRTSQNYSWSYKATTGAVNTMTRDVFSRDVQREMGRPYTRSRYHHLYLNGEYWGIFQTQERAEASFAAAYLGGEPEDYDVVKVNGDDPTDRVIEATDGDLDAWERVWDACQAGFDSDGAYHALQGKLADGNDDPHGEVLVDVDNLIDYMIVIFYTGNFDSPTGSFTGNKGPNNFFCIRDRSPASNGFVFFAHDAEHSLHTQAWSPGVGQYENRVELGDIGGDYRMVVTEFENFHPQWLHHRLTANARYRDRFNERVHEHLLGDGVLDEENAAALFQSRADEIEAAIIAESARWGDSKSFNEAGRTYRTRDDDWTPTVEDTVDHYFLGLDGHESRTQIVLQQLSEAGLYW